MSKNKKAHDKLEWQFEVADTYDFPPSVFHTSKWYNSEEEARRDAKKYSSNEFSSVSFKTRAKN